MAAMTPHALGKTLALGTLTGMRSMAGPSALAFRHRGLLKTVVGTMAAAEMIADKTSVVGDRIDPIPLAGRAFMGALVGGAIAYEEEASIPLGVLAGALAAVAAAHLAYHARKRLAASSIAGGFVEDAIVVGLTSLAVRQRV